MCLGIFMVKGHCREHTTALHMSWSLRVDPSLSRSGEWQRRRPLAVGGSDDQGPDGDLIERTPKLHRPNAQVWVTGIRYVRTPSVVMHWLPGTTRYDSRHVHVDSVVSCISLFNVVPVRATYTSGPCICQSGECEQRRRRDAWRGARHWLRGRGGCRGELIDSRSRVASCLADSPAHVQRLSM